MQQIGLNGQSPLQYGSPYVLPTSFATIHTAAAGTSAFDLVYLSVTNTDTVARSIIIAVGGQTDPGNRIVYNQSIPANGIITPVMSGYFITNGLIVYAAAGGTATRLLIAGYVLRGP